MKSALLLHDAIAAVCPIVGVSIGDPADQKIWRIVFEDTANQSQRSDAATIMAAWSFEPSLAEVKAEIKARVDAAAEAQRLLYITPGAGQALVYEAKRTEASRWFAAGEPTSPDAATYPWAAERATRLGTTVASVLTEWLAQASAWATIGRAIEGAREGAKEAIAAAGDEKTARAVLDGLNWPAGQ